LASGAVQQLHVPYGCKEGHLIGRSRHGGVSRSCSSAESSELDALRAIWIISFMWSIAVHTMDRGVGACRTFLAGRKGTRMLASVVRVGANGTAGVITTKCGRMSVVLAVVTLGASSVWDVVIQLTFPVADNEILATDASLFDISCKCHHNCGIRFLFASFGSSQPTWCLTLDELWVVCGNTVRNFGE
jgi:hypothetical protein